MSLTIELRRTDELAAADRARLCALFESVFQKACPEDLFLRKYAQAWQGRSYHALARHQGVIAGAYSAIPVRYSYFGRETLFAIPADLMMEPRFRGDVKAVYQLSRALYESLADAGVAFVFGSLREEMVSFHERLGGWRKIGPMPYYVAPLRGPLSVLARAAGLFRPAAAMPEPEIGKIDDRAFRDYRYRIFPTEYRTIAAGGGQGIYTGRMFYEIPAIPRGMRLSLLVDVSPLRPGVFNAVVEAIRRTEPRIDYLAYQGRLPFRPKLMWRVPRNFERPRWYACGRILLPEALDQRIYDIRNWNINLSNGDIV